MTQGIGGYGRSNIDAWQRAQEQEREHDGAHTRPAFDPSDDDTCRECWLEAALPPQWGAGGEKLCLAVPVQAIETWLLTLRGEVLTPTPEHVFYRHGLKRRFFGKGNLPASTRLAMARAELERPTALAVLRNRPSFQRFEARLASWR